MFVWGTALFQPETRPHLSTVATNKRSVREASHTSQCFVIERASGRSKYLAVPSLSTPAWSTFFPVRQLTVLEIRRNEMKMKRHISPDSCRKKGGPKPPAELGKFGFAGSSGTSSQVNNAFEDIGGLTTLLTVCRNEDDIQRMREVVRKDGDQP